MTQKGVKMTDLEICQNVNVHFLTERAFTIFVLVHFRPSKNMKNRSKNS